MSSKNPEDIHAKISLNDLLDKKSFTEEIKFIGFGFSDGNNLSDFDQELKKTELNHKKLEVERNKEDQKLKVNIFYWTKKIVRRYLIFVAVILSISSIKILNPYLGLDNNVLITLLATTTATIIGLPALIIHSLFPKNKKEIN